MANVQNTTVHKLLQLLLIRQYCIFIYTQKRPTQLQNSSTRLLLWATTFNFISI